MLAKNGRKGLIIGASVLCAVFLKHLFSIKLSVSKKEAVNNGLKLLDIKGNILAVTAHPDDLELFMGGTLRLLSQRYNIIHIVDVTDGEKGVRRRNLAETRRKEQLEAGRVLGIENIHFLHLPDMHLNKTDNLEKILQDKIQSINPDVVFTFDYKYPFRAIRHPDHIAVGEAVTEIVKEKMSNNSKLIFYATRKPDTAVNISNSIISKISSIKRHKSQLRFGPKPYSSITRAFARYNALGLSGNYFETFRVG